MYNLRKFQLLIGSALILIFLIVSSITATSYFKKHYIKQGREQIINQLNHANQQQAKKDQGEIKHAKQIDKTVGAMSDNVVIDSLHNDFRDRPEDQQNGSVQAVAKDQSKQKRHNRNAETGISKQSETDSVLQEHKYCYSAQLENNDGTLGEAIAVCDE